MADPETTLAARSDASANPTDSASLVAPWDLAKLTVDHFVPLVGQPFDIQTPATPDASSRWTLVDASPLPIPARPLPNPRVPFTLTFASEHRQTALRQGIRTISHPQFGRAEVFLVPVDSHSPLQHLEAIFY